MKTPVIHFLSDLHLSDEQAHLTNLFVHYLEHYAPAADEIYLLGDLFEVWIGDDYQPDWLEPINQHLIALMSQDKRIYFCHGNRDFLVGERYAKHVGLTLLNEYHSIELASIPTLLCHGDTLCTDDIPYQEFRSEVRTTQWQNQFLSLPIEQRLNIVNSYREQSKQATSQKQQSIMDVNQQTVESVAAKYACQLIIHGHTHRPDCHIYDGFRRLVLSDWREQGHFVSVEQDTFSDIYFDTTHMHHCELLNS